jgi:hypothetical protein
MATGGLHSHLFSYHPIQYIEEVIHNGWPVKIPALVNQLTLGWTLLSLLEKLKQDLNCDISSLGANPNAVALSAVGVAASDNDLVPVFSIEEMQRQLIKFIVADDQVISYLLSMLLIINGYF